MVVYDDDSDGLLVRYYDQLTKFSRGRSPRPYRVGGFSLLANGNASLLPTAEATPVNFTYSDIRQEATSLALPPMPNLNESHNSVVQQDNRLQQQLNCYDAMVENPCDYKPEQIGFPTRNDQQYRSEQRLRALENDYETVTPTLEDHFNKQESLRSRPRTTEIATPPKKNATNEATEGAVEWSQNYLEEILEQKRQLEIYERYKKWSHEGKPDRFERIYLMEGFTLAQTQSSGLFHIMENSLSDYYRLRHSSDDDPSNCSWKSSHSRESTCMNPSSFTLENAQQVARQCNSLGKPIPANPAVVARNRIRATTREDDEERLREELEAMATGNQESVTYRLITAPNAVLIAILRKTDMIEVRKCLLLARPSTLIAVDDPEMLLDAITVFRPPKMSKTVWKRKKQITATDEELCILKEENSDHEKAKRAKKKVGRKTRRGRPKGANKTKTKSEREKAERQEAQLQIAKINASVKEKEILKQHQERAPAKATSSEQRETTINGESGMNSS